MRYAFYILLVHDHRIGVTTPRFYSFSVSVVQIPLPHSSQLSDERLNDRLSLCCTQLPVAEHMFWAANQFGDVPKTYRIAHLQQICAFKTDVPNLVVFLEQVCFGVS